jgi:hypothetical protein
VAQQAQAGADKPTTRLSAPTDDGVIQDDGSTRQPHTWEWRHRNEPCKGKPCTDSETQSADLFLAKASPGPEAAQQAQSKAETPMPHLSKPADNVQNDRSIRQPNTWEWRHRNEDSETHDAERHRSKP